MHSYFTKLTLAIKHCDINKLFVIYTLLFILNSFSCDCHKNGKKTNDKEKPNDAFLDPNNSPGKHITSNPLAFAKLVQEAHANSLTYIIENLTNETINNITLTYANTSQNQAEKQVSIAGKPTDNISVASLGPKARTALQNLAISFNGAHSATFTFKILHNGLEVCSAQYIVTNKVSMVGSQLYDKITSSQSDGAELLDLLNNGQLDKNILSYQEPIMQKSLLMQAIENDKLDIAQALIEKGMDASLINEQKTKSGQTALMYAAEKGNKDQLELLLNKGAAVGIQDQSGKTALMYAAARDGDTEALKVLLDNNASVDVKNGDGQTALMYAAQKGHTAALKVLLDKSASVNIKDKSGQTALMYAAANGNKEQLALLLDKNASVDVNDQFGKTALMYAAENGHTEAFNFLLDKMM